MSTNRKEFSQEKIEDMLESYSRKESMRSIAKRYSVDPKVIRRILREHEIDIRGVECNGTPYTFNENFFKEIVTEGQAYWLGFMSADGYVTKGKVFGIKLSTRDIDHLYKFKESLKSEHPIKTYLSRGGDFSGDNYQASQLVITNRGVVEDLEKYGITNKKSHYNKFPSLPTELHRHFIRGYFDGDGSIHNSTTVKGTRKYEYPTISILGTEEMVGHILETLCPESKSKVYYRNGAHYIVLRGYKRLSKIREYLYKDSTIYLDRKREKFYEITR